MVDSTGDPAHAWWRDGLPFACTQCGKCCEARGEVAHVYVGEEDQERLAGHLGLSRRAFLSRYTRSEDGGYRGLRFVDGRCIFLDGTRCRVHEAKPTQCRTWPFWPELLASPEAYREEVQDFCPGSRAPGPVVPAASIARQLEETEQALED